MVGRRPTETLQLLASVGLEAMLQESGILSLQLFHCVLDFIGLSWWERGFTAVCF